MSTNDLIKYSSVSRKLVHDVSHSLFHPRHDIITHLVEQVSAQPAGQYVKVVIGNWFREITRLMID